MISMMCCAFVRNFFRFSLPVWLFTRGMAAFHTYCGSLQAENETGRHFIHHLLFRCKITKFISFSCKNRWKSGEKAENNLVDIPIAEVRV